MLERIRKQLHEHLQVEGASAPLAGLGTFHCRHDQIFREVPIIHPCVVLVVEGTKRLSRQKTKYQFRKGELLILPGDTTVTLDNIPDETTREYIALTLSFSPEEIQLFRQMHSNVVFQSAVNDRWYGPISKQVQTAIAQLLEWLTIGKNVPLRAIHRRLEILWLLAQDFGIASMFLNREPSCRQRVAEVIATDITRSWLAREVASKLAMGESTLRNRLQQEESSFRLILEDTRLSVGFGLLQETNWTVAMVASSVGYESQSRFGERFKKRYGMTPLALRRTRQHVMRS